MTTRSAFGARLYVGCAGWSIPGLYADYFPTGGTHLERYAARFPAVEINSSFYRAHRPTTYARWARSVPEGFRFAVKLPRQITHRSRLRDLAVLDEFLPAVSHLGEKLGPLLVQLPPGLSFEAESARAFFEALRERFEGHTVCEPRHPSWFSPEAEALLREWRIARVAADPAPVPEGTASGGWEGLRYYRLHGSPRMYHSPYSEAFLRALAQELIRAPVETWCIFNNTAQGAATGNALRLIEWLTSAEAFS